MQRMRLDSFINVDLVTGPSKSGDTCGALHPGSNPSLTCTANMVGGARAGVSIDISELHGRAS